MERLSNGEKKEANLVLVQLGRRFIALDFKGKVAYYVFPSDLQAKGADFESGDLFVRSRVMPTTAGPCATWGRRK